MILASYEVKRAGMSNFWTFWAIIQLKIPLTPYEEVSSLLAQNVQKLLILAVFAA